MNYDVIIVGGGHAGVEAALASARLGVKTALITNNKNRISYMSCNPSIGGLGKGHIVKEIDALGGEMARITDASCIQFKRLNNKKGPAVRGSRAQCDKDLYSQFMSSHVQNVENLTIHEFEIQALILNNNVCKGVVTTDGVRVNSNTVVISTGTFMRAIMHFGLIQIEGGRVGDKSTIGISDQLKDFGFTVKRLKTGTPPRLLDTSIDWSKTEAQSGDAIFRPMSYLSEAKLSLPQIKCFLSYTNEQTHDIIRKNLNKSPMFTGAIEGIGPRYCPSIEDKITRFENRDRHQTFLEPEGLNTNSIYLQGISTSLPEEVQYEFLRTIPGLNNVKLIKPGYAVEYDYIEPTQIMHTLETRLIQNLFLAGQINGTSGYEEAAGQGLVAGTNAALKVLERTPFTLQREESYIGVLIDDLVTKGTKEPYRMMTSRAEHRLVLREDNVLERLCEKGRAVGLLNDSKYEVYLAIKLKREKFVSDLTSTVVVPNRVNIEKLRAIGTPDIQKPMKISELMRRSEFSSLDAKAFGINIPDEPLVYEPVEISIKYSGYIDRQNEIIKQTKRLENLDIPTDMDYGIVKGLSLEEVEKLTVVKPATLGQAQRISGVNPSAIQAILIHIKGKQRRFKEVQIGRPKQQ